MKHKLECHFYFCGISLDKEKPYQGDMILVERREVEYENQDLKNCIRIIYRTSIDGDNDFYQDFINQTVLSEVNLFVETLYLMLINPCEFLIVKIFLNDVEVEPKYPPQPIPSGLYNLIAQRVQPKSEIQNITTSVHETGWSLLETVVKEFHKKPQNLRQNLVLTLRWCAKGSGEFSSMDRLVAYWIAFNVLYEGCGKSERESIANFLDTTFDSVIAKRFYKNFEKKLRILSTLKIELRGGIKISDELGNLLDSSAKDLKPIIKATILTIYGIRNNLFHGDYDPNSRETLRHVGIAERLLSEFLKEIVVQQMIGYALPSSIFRLETTVGF